MKHSRLLWCLALLLTLAAAVSLQASTHAMLQNPIDSVLHPADSSPADLEKRVLRIGTLALSALLLTSVLLWVKVTNDINRRKRAERLVNLQSQALEQATDGIAIIDLKGRLGYTNAAFDAMHGYKSGELLRKPIDLLQGADAKWVEIYTQSREQINPSGRQERVRHLRKDKSTFPAQASASLLRDEAGKPAGVILVANDITDQMRLEEELRQSQRLEAVGRLAGGVAHDFNNYLTVILGHCELAEAEDSTDEAMRSSLVQIRVAGQRAADLTRQLLAFGRRQVIHPVVLDVNTMVRDTERMIAGLLMYDVRVVVSLASQLKPIRADATQLQQVLMNLAVNGREAMPDGGTLTIATEKHEQHEASAELRPGQYVKITVSDTGHGMPPDVSERVFEPFFTTKRQGRGTGLGLAIVYGIVKQAYGHVTFETAPGKGTRFDIYWPQVEGTVEPPKKPRPAALNGTERVLVVDDTDEVRALASRILRNLGYKVWEAGNGEEAEDLAAKLTFDLLLTDVVLPGANGRQMAQRLQSIQPGLRVIYMSGYSEDSVAQRGLSQDTAKIIQKPFTADELGIRVSQVLHPS
ncbi:MAG: ATP-binding protein [Bryobacteraceae bacterium]